MKKVLAERVPSGSKVGGSISWVAGAGGSKRRERMPSCRGVHVFIHRAWFANTMRKRPTRATEKCAHVCEPLCFYDRIRKQRHLVLKRGRGCGWVQTPRENALLPWGARVHNIQGYLAHKTTPSPRTIIGP